MKTDTRVIAGTAGLTVVLLVAALLWAWEHHATKSGSPGILKVATTPVGNLLSGEQTPTPVLPTVKVMRPMTGGGAIQTVKSATEEKTAEHGAATSQPPSSISSVSPSPPVDKTSDGSLVLVTNATDNKDAEHRPRAAPEAGSMQPGAIVAKGRQAPALQLTLPSTEVRSLVASGKAYVIAENEQSGTVLVLDHPDKPFRPVREIHTDSMSNRYVAIADPGLIQAWQIRLGRLPTENFSFGLRFSQNYDATIAERQFESLAKRGIDFDQALAAGRTITTHGNIGADLVFAVSKVSFDDPHHSPLE